MKRFALPLLVFIIFTTAHAQPTRAATLQGVFTPSPSVQLPTDLVVDTLDYGERAVIEVRSPTANNLTGGEQFQLVLPEPMAETALFPGLNLEVLLNPLQWLDSTAPERCHELMKPRHVPMSFIEGIRLKRIEKPTPHLAVQQSPNLVSLQDPYLRGTEQPEYILHRIYAAREVKMQGTCVDALEYHKGDIDISYSVLMDFDLVLEPGWNIVKVTIAHADSASSKVTYRVLDEVPEDAVWSF